MTAGAPDVAGRLARLILAERARLRPRDALEVLSLLLGDRVQVGDASRYVYEYGRRAGYELPPYPLAGCGEIREFFADQGVRNVPEWYERKLGVGPQLYAQLAARTVVVVRDGGNRRKAFVLDAVRHCQDAGFANLSESGLARTLAPDGLAELLDRIMAFLLDEGAPAGEPVATAEGSQGGDSAPCEGTGTVRFESPLF